MLNTQIISFAMLFLSCSCFAQKVNKEPISYVNYMIETGGDENLFSTL